MNDFALSWGELPQLSAPVCIGIKWTALLCVGWIANGLLCNSNPRWRVLTWRCVAFGILLTPACHWLAPTRIELDNQRTNIAVVEIQAVPGVDPESVSGSGFSPPAAARDEIEPELQPSQHAQLGWLGSSFLWLIAIPGCLAFLVRLSIGWYRVGRLIQGSQPATPRVISALERVSADLAIARSVDVRVTDQTTAPTLCGVFRPTLLIPCRMQQREHAAELPAVFAHELSHVRAKDVAWNLLLHFNASVLWFHPLAWFTRTAHGSACESVSDAVAASYLGNVREYCRILARVALDANTSIVLGMGMARISNVSRRIRALQTTLFASELRPAKSMLYMGTLLVLAIGSGGVQVVTAEPQPQAGSQSQTSAAQSDNPREKRAELYTEQTKAAVDNALSFLVARQQEDGSFGKAAFGDQRIAISALCGLAFLNEDLRSKGQAHKMATQRCRTFILAQQQPNGSIAGKGGLMYIHAYAIQFLAEAQIVAPNAKTKEALEKAVALTVKSQNKWDGWRYQPNSQDADVSATSCQLLALAAARRAGISVPQATIDRAVGYVSRCQAEDGGFSYTTGTVAQSGLPRSAAAMAALLASESGEETSISRGITYLKQNAERGNAGDSYFYYGEYYRSRSMQHTGFESFRRWYQRRREQLRSDQLDDHSWPDPGFGPEYSTATACIVLLSPHWNVRSVNAR